MTLTIELPPELEARLKAEADRHGLPIAEYALTLLRATVSAPGLPSQPISQARPRRLLRPANCWRCRQKSVTGRSPPRRRMPLGSMRRILTGLSPNAK